MSEEAKTVEGLRLLTPAELESLKGGAPPGPLAEPALLETSEEDAEEEE